MSRRSIFAGIAIAAIIAGCSGERQLFSPQDVDRLVVNSMLFVDQPLPNIALYRTQSPEGRFDPKSAAERGASVTVFFDSIRVDYQEFLPGVYEVDYTEPPLPRVVLPEKTYRLEVVTRFGERLNAATTTPPRIEVTDWVLLDNEGSRVVERLKTFADLGDSVYYAPENQLIYSYGLLEAWVNPIPTAAFQAGIYSLDLDSDFVIDPEFLEDEDFDEFERRIASPPILPSETFIRLPWFAIYFGGRYKIKIFAVDRNWYDMARTIPELSGGGGFGGNAGDDFERPIFHVNGGIGLFGSASVDSVGFFVHPRP
jgi:hypothetical protein